MRVIKHLEIITITGIAVNMVIIKNVLEAWNCFIGILNKPLKEQAVTENWP